MLVVLVALVALVVLMVLTVLVTLVVLVALVTWVRLAVGASRADAGVGAVCGAVCACRRW